MEMTRVPRSNSSDNRRKTFEPPASARNELERGVRDVLERGFILLALALLPCAGIASAAEPGDWLDVKECGASGSEFSATAATAAGSEQITVANVGDFKPGQGVILSRCNIQYPGAALWDGMYSRKPLADAVEIRGYEGANGGWMVFAIDVDGANPPTFRWSDDIARTWKVNKVPITFDWQPLSGGVEIHFNKREWQPGNVITFSARDSLQTTIEKIEGNVLTVKDAPNRTVKDAVVRHEDSAALQAIVNRAIQEKKNVYLPVGHYRLARGLTVSDAAAIALEGASGVDTVLDISEATGTILKLRGGKDVTVRNFRMIGNSGLAEKAGFINSSGGYGIWGMTLKFCNAVSIGGTERVLVENVHASRMSCECFYASGPSREVETIHEGPAKFGTEKPKQYTKEITYLRCSVTDCGFNAFNNNDLSESTSMLYCRVENIGNCFWEGPGRFIRIIGCYARNAGVCSVGNMFHRYEFLHDLGPAQTIVSDNVFEGISPNAAAVHVGHGAQQVIISNNLFINYGSTGVHLDSRDKSDFSTTTGGKIKSSYPARHIIVSGNIMDLTNSDPKLRERAGVDIGLSDVIVSGNQIYVRGKCDPKVAGIRIKEPALNVNVHDNLIRNCGSGLTTYRLQAKVGQVIDSTTFLRKGALLPLEWRTSHLYRGWNVVWFAGGKPSGTSVIDAWNPDTLAFKLTAPHAMKVDDVFEIHPPSANWNIHDNTVTSCARPVVLDSYGSETSLFRNNIITRGDVQGVAQAVVVAGRFNLIGNNISGFDEKDSSAIMLNPDRFGNPVKNILRNNTIERCDKAVTETQKGLQ
jgi:hypothetical protein